MAEPKAAEVGRKGTLKGQPYEVKESCGSNVGGWACLTHNKTFVNQFDKDTHISGRNDCVLAWICLDHGIEKP